MNQSRPNAQLTTPKLNDKPMIKANLFFLFPSLGSDVELKDEESIVCVSIDTTVAAEKPTPTHSDKTVVKSTVYKRLGVPLKIRLSAKVRNTLKFLVVEL